MKRFQYKILECKFEEMEKKLNEYGRDGWFIERWLEDFKNESIASEKWDKAELYSRVLLVQEKII